MELDYPILLHFNKSGELGGESHLLAFKSWADFVAFFKRCRHMWEGGIKPRIWIVRDRT